MDYLEINVNARVTSSYQRRAASLISAGFTLARKVLEKNQNLTDHREYVQHSSFLLNLILDHVQEPCYFTPIWKSYLVSMNENCTASTWFCHKWLLWQKSTFNFVREFGFQKSIHGIHRALAKEDVKSLNISVFHNAPNNFFNLLLHGFSWLCEPHTTRCPLGVEGDLSG